MTGIEDRPAAPVNSPSPRLVAAFCAHPAWARDYLRCATFKAWLAAADDPELAELPPPSPWPISADQSLQ